MRARLFISLAVLGIVLGYMASPYVALCRLAASLDRGDRFAVERDVDWAAVKAGLKQDIADGIIGPTSGALASNALPPFGASFASGLAETAVEHEVTPQNIIAVMRQMQGGEAMPNPLTMLEHAFFETPTSFLVSIRNTDEDDGHLRLRMVLQEGHWRVVRAWIPQSLIERAAQRT